MITENWLYQDVVRFNGNEILKKFFLVLKNGMGISKKSIWLMLGSVLGRNH
jgi:hypothetical protein